jgi:hypothetical protein
MDSEPPHKPRPYWHVDAKWITGLSLAFVLGLTLLVYNLVQITAEEPAVETMTMAMALMFSPDGLDADVDITQLRQQLNAAPDGSIRPIPGLRITIREEDIAGLSPREMRLFFFRQLAGPLYRGGVEGLKELATTPEMAESFEGGIGPLAVFTLETHQTLQRVLVLLSIISLVLLVPLILFSYRFGRLGSPGCVLFVASLPGAILFTFLATTLQNPPGPPQGEGISEMLGYLVANSLAPLVQIVSRNYLVLVVVGAGMIILAALGGLIWRLARRDRRVEGNVEGQA